MLYSAKGRKSKPQKEESRKGIIAWFDCVELWQNAVDKDNKSSKNNCGFRKYF
jgi:hypothetical protein